MKTINISALLLLIIWSALTTNAQQMINTAEKYNIGESYSYWRADTANLYTGVAGENVTWDFSSLQKLQGDRNGQVLLLSQTQYANKFPNSNEVRKLSDGSYLFLDRKADSVFLTGFRQDFTDIDIHYTKPQLFAVNPIKYGDSYVATSVYNYTFGNQDFVGGGFFGMEADGWGTLILDGVTYDNVLRVKIRQENADTIKPFNTVVSTTTITNYRWYNQYNGIPLLSIDSVVVNTQGGNQKRMEILGLKNSIGALSIAEYKEPKYEAVINGQQLLISGGNTPVESLAVYDISGRLIASKSNFVYGTRLKLELPYVPQQGQLFIIKIKTATKAHFIKLGVSKY